MFKWLRDRRIRKRAEIIADVVGFIDSRAQERSRAFAAELIATGPARQAAARERILADLKRSGLLAGKTDDEVEALVAEINRRATALLEGNG